jgi:peptide deformylase
VAEEDQEERQQPQIDPEVRARREAAFAHIRQFGDPILRTKARPIDTFDQSLREEIERMGRLMSDAFGVGLAAPQAGVANRLLVYRTEPDSPIQALVNPEIEWTSRDKEWGEEGCLSLQGVLVEVERPVHVRVRAQDEDGERITVEASGFEARVIQHEVDHLDGVLILDRTTRDQRKEAVRALRERERAREEAALGRGVA